MPKSGVDWTIDVPSSRPDEGFDHRLALDDIQPILVISTHMSADELTEIEEALIDASAPITYDVREARLFITKVTQRRRAIIELRTRGVFTEDKSHGQECNCSKDQLERINSQPPRTGKKRRHDSAIVSEEQKPHAVDLTVDSSTESESGEPFVTPSKSKQESEEDFAPKENASIDPSNVVVLSSRWLFDSLQDRRKQAFGSYTVYEGRLIERPTPTPLNQKCGLINNAPKVKDPLVVTTASNDANRPNRPDTILERAQNEAQPPRPSEIVRKRFHGAVEQRDRDGGYSSRTQRSALARSSQSDDVASLTQQSTTEHDLDLRNDTPEPPGWVKKGYKYACQRRTPVSHPNQKFVEMLKEIRTTRDLIGDDIGIRAYSTAIASISAYPYSLTSPREITALPGCSNRIAALFAEWKNNGEQDVQIVREAKSDSRLQVLRVFFEIWGVGAATSRAFYNNGWRDLDDIVEHGWNDIGRVQQIGVKYYEEFQQKIPRVEVEEIRQIVHRHAEHVCGDTKGVRTTVVGGYRRGKAESGDADIMVSHFDDARTLDIVDHIVESLTEEGWITHSLGTAHSGSRRGQQTLPYKGPGSGSGFDTLDKAMVVWQDARYRDEDAVDGKNPNVHRRVDIIISPWRTIGCAVLGWSAGTTFERDLRRYAKYTKNWKFDSSGIRDRATGQVVDVEEIGGRAATIDEAERKVFQGLGLDYIEPWDRCTG